MKIELIKPIKTNFTTEQQILINRGFSIDEIDTYTHLDDSFINEPELFGELLMESASKCFIDTLNKDKDICVVVDCDVDGYSSAAIIINYIYDLKDANYAKNHIHWFLHPNKAHGIKDAMDWILKKNPSLVIVPDGGTNDKKELQILEDKGIDVIILDHHLIEEMDFWRTEAHPHLYLINSQVTSYPNKFLSGGGVVWQFCRYVSQLKGIEEKHIEDLYLDLVATALVGDMMSLHSYETRRLITKGLMPENIHNPLIYGLWQKSKFKLGENPVAWGFTFYVVPLINAITRTGTMTEKEIIFKSMLKFEAFEEILSDKRGHKQGEMEQVVEQALRVCTRVKKRQTDEENSGLPLLEKKIKDNDMMKNKVLIFLLEPGEIRAEIRGLLANKIQAKYQRPCCVLTKVEKDNGKITFEGSARGCDMVGVTNFKNICESTGVCNYTVGHEGAFGLGITWQYDDISAEVAGDDFYIFTDKTNKILANMPSEPTYYVDYIWSADEADGDRVLDIADMNKYWGKDCEESHVAIKDIRITKDMIKMMKSNTCKICLPSGVDIIKFGMSEKDYDSLYSEDGYVTIDAICTCDKNEWNGNVYPQLRLKNFEIKQQCAYFF